MTTIYAVSSGSYSDYRVCALFSTKALAEKYMEANVDSWDSYNDIEEYQLDPDKDELVGGYVYWKVEMLVSGDRAKAERSAKQEWNHDQMIGDTFNGGKRIPLDKEKRVWFSYCYAKDEQHAIKIANERRIQYLATENLK